MSLLSQITYRLDRLPLCSNCKMRLIAQTTNCSVCGVALSPNIPAIYQFVSIKWVWNHHEVTCNPHTHSEATLALKELKLAKRGISNVKRQIMEAKRVLRADYTEANRKRHPFSDWLLFKPSPRVRRKIMAQDLAPLESEQQTLENLRIQVEQSIVNLEGSLMS